MATSLGILAGHLKDAVIARYAQGDVPGGEALPARQYVGFGQPGSIAADEPDPTNPKGSLMVAPQAITTTVRAGTGAGRGEITTHTGTIQLRLLRPFPWFTAAGNLPTPDQVTAAALMLSDDQARIVEALHSWSDLLKSTPATAFLEVVWGSVDAISPSGGLAGNRVTATLGPV